MFIALNYGSFAHNIHMVGWIGSNPGRDNNDSNKLSIRINYNEVIVDPILTGLHVNFLVEIHFLMKENAS